MTDPTEGAATLLFKPRQRFRPYCEGQPRQGWRNGRLRHPATG